MREIVYVLPVGYCAASEHGEGVGAAARGSGRLARWPTCLDLFNWRDIVPRLVVIISTGSRSKAAAVQKANRSGFRFHPGRPIGSVTTI